MLADVAAHDDLGHPLCGNLREGNWLLGYLTSRLQRRSSVTRFAEFLKGIFGQVQETTQRL